MRVTSDTVDGRRSTLLRSDGQGSWTVDGVPAPHLDGLVDVDLEASACTNTLPVHRLTMPVGEVVVASAVYVQASDLAVRRLDQTYDASTTTASPTRRRVAQAVLRYDGAGLVLDYPGIAVRFA